MMEVYMTDTVRLYVNDGFNKYGEPFSAIEFNSKATIESINTRIINDKGLEYTSLSRVKLPVNAKTLKVTPDSKIEIAGKSHGIQKINTPSSFSTKYYIEVYL